MDVRNITIDELEAFQTTFTRTMGFGPPSEAQLERDKKSYDVTRSAAAFDGSEIVGTGYSHAFELTLPGDARVPVAGVTAISTASTHRRQGVLSSVMRKLIVDAHERGDAALILIASEGKIYGRFGYGIATQVCDIKVVTSEAQFAKPNTGGKIRIVDGETSDTLFPPVLDAARWRPGSLNRPKHFWESITADRDKKTVHIVYEDASGTARGFVKYSVSGDWHDGIPTHKLSIGEFFAETDDATLELWWYLINLDLVREISAFSRPPDDPLRWVLNEPRALRSQTTRDMLWMRPLDVPRLLTSRSYAADVDVTLDVADPTLEQLGGKFRLTVTGGAASVTRVDGGADVRMSMTQLGSLVLGGIPASELARAGRVDADAAVLAKIDAAFMTYPRPFTNQYF